MSFEAASRTARVPKAARCTVRVRCVMCGAKKSIGPGQVAPGDYPMCGACLGPMVPVAAERR